MEKERAGLPSVGNICWSMEKKKEESWTPLLWEIFVGVWKRRKKRSGISLYGEYLLPPQEHGRDKDFPFVGNILYHNYISPINITVVIEYNAFITDLLPQALRKISLCDIVYRKKNLLEGSEGTTVLKSLSSDKKVWEGPGAVAQFEQDLEPQGSCPWPRGHSSELWAQHSPQLTRAPRCAPRCAPKPAAPGRAGRTDLCSW